MSIRERIIMASLIGLFVLSLVLAQFNSNTSSTQRQSKSSSDLVAVIPIYGPIQLESPDFFQTSGIDGVRNQLTQAANREDVKAVILRVNSPGGSVGSSQELFSTIQQFKKETAKPVVVSIVDSGASGAYWISLASDHIVAQPGSLVGSLGVIIQVPDFTQVQEKYGVAFKTYKAGKMKDILNPWRSSTPEEEALIRTHLKDVHQQFIEVLMTQRSFTQAKAQQLADGRIFTGRKAKEIGLIDSLGGLDAAIIQAQILANLESVPTIIYLQEASFRSLFRSFRMSIANSFRPFLFNEGVLVR